MSNNNNSNRKYPGTLLTMLFSTRSGKQNRSMAFDETGFAKFMQAMQDAGPGCKVVLKETSPDYRATKKVSKAGREYDPAQYVLEVLTAAELQAERDALNGNKPAGQAPTDSI